jgi:hypothetical protein
MEEITSCLSFEIHAGVLHLLELRAPVLKLQNIYSTSRIVSTDLLYIIQAMFLQTLSIH